MAQIMVENVTQIIALKTNSNSLQIRQNDLTSQEKKN